MRQKNLLIAAILIFVPFIIILLIDASGINPSSLVGSFNPYTFFGIFDLFQIVSIIFSIRSLKRKETSGGGITLIVVSIILILLSFWAIGFSQVQG